MGYRTNDKVPMTRSTMGRCYVCNICKHRVGDRRQMGDRGTFPGRNRARGLMVKHINEKHPAEVT